MTDVKKIGSQLVCESYDIAAPNYELLGTDIESTIDELLEKAVRTGEAFSQARFVRDGTYAPFAHRACTEYHAIEIIRFLQKELARYETRPVTSTPPTENP